MKKLSQAGVLTEERIEAILSEENPNQKPKIKVPMERIQKYFSPDDITNWRYPASRYVREANGSIRVVYSLIGS